MQNSFYEKLANELLNIAQPIKNKNLEAQLKSEMLVLLFIDKNEKVLPKLISERFGVSSARTAVILNELQKRKLINRCPDKNDKRKVVVSLTNLGAQTAKEQKEFFVNKISCMLEKLGKRDAKTYLRITKNLIDIKNDTSNTNCAQD